ncbi:MAG: type II toxin-antitoxin system RelB/DinJ family antitoxin [Lachnospiraceae bacterium]
MNYNIINRRCLYENSTVSARVENNVKIEAEDILQKLGVPVSVVINSLYRQIIYHHGVPFSLRFRQNQEPLMQCLMPNLTQNSSTATHRRLPVRADQ